MSLHKVYIKPLEAIYDGRKSFYGKARVIEFSDGSIFLVSYDALMCKIEEGELVYTYAGRDSWSCTTGRHLVEFSRQYGGDYGGKKSVHSARAISWQDSLEYTRAVRGVY